MLTDRPPLKRRAINDQFTLRDDSRADVLGPVVAHAFSPGMVRS
jgi:hypothetical protein